MRLSRRICADCKIADEKFPEALAKMGMTEDQIRTAKIMKGRGCGTCNNTGYKGRVALYEVMPFVDPLKELVLQGASARIPFAHDLETDLPALHRNVLERRLRTAPKARSPRQFSVFDPKAQPWCDLPSVRHGELPLPRPLEGRIGSGRIRRMRQEPSSRDDSNRHRQTSDKA